MRSFELNAPFWTIANRNPLFELMAAHTVACLAFLKVVDANEMGSLIGAQVALLPLSL